MREITLNIILSESAHVIKFQVLTSIFKFNPNILMDHFFFESSWRSFMWFSLLNWHVFKKIYLKKIHEQLNLRPYSDSQFSKTISDANPLWFCPQDVQIYYNFCPPIWPQWQSAKHRLLKVYHKNTSPY